MCFSYKPNTLITMNDLLSKVRMPMIFLKHVLKFMKQKQNKVCTILKFQHISNNLDFFLYHHANIFLTNEFDRHCLSFIDLYKYLF